MLQIVKDYKELKKKYAILVYDYMCLRQKYNNLKQKKKR